MCLLKKRKHHNSIKEYEVIMGQELESLGRLFK